MEEQCDLFLKVLTKFHSSGVLDNVILIGSWSTYFYKDYFSAQNYYPTIKTTDMYFLVPLPIKTKKKVDIAELLRPDDFKVIFSNSGFIQLENPGLTIEFLVPERGKGTEGPFILPQFGISAQPLRMLDILAQNTILVESKGIKVSVPHPAAYGLHKLIVSQRRTSKEKMLKDRESGMSVLRALIEKGESDTIKTMFNNMLPAWREKVLDALTKYDEQDVMRVLKQNENIKRHRGRHL